MLCILTEIVPGLLLHCIKSQDDDIILFAGISISCV